MKRRPNDELRLELPIGVSFASLIEAEETFRDLINEVGRSVVESSSDPIQWVVTDVERASVRFVVQARAASKKVAPSQMPEAVEAISSGLETLEERAERPEHFSYRALEKAKKLGKMSTPESPIAVQTGQSIARLTAQIVANIDKLIGKPLRSIGRVEGTLERLNVHDKRTFNVYDRLTGQGIECNFGKRIAVPDIAAAVERRVAVYGEIRYSPTGELLNVIAEELEVFPAQSELPTAQDVRGILG